MGYATHARRTCKLCFSLVTAGGGCSEVKVPEQQCSSAFGSAIGEKLVCSVLLGGLIHSRRCAMCYRLVQRCFCTRKWQVKDLCLIIAIHSEQ